MSVSDVAWHLAGQLLARQADFLASESVNRDVNEKVFPPAMYVVRGGRATPW